MHAIPTLYKGRQFRSRLEARWAAFFDCMHWPFEYEPIELAGYIPDFIITWPHSPLLVEVKPAIVESDLYEHVEKIEQSGWQHESLLVGARLFSGWGSDFPSPGIIGGGSEYNDHCNALFFTCAKCKQTTVCSTDNSFHCRTNGCYDGDHYQLPCQFDVHAAWLHAGNITQWRGIAS